MNKLRVTGDTLVATAAFPLKLHTITVAPTTATPTAGLLTVYDSTSKTGAPRSIPSGCSRQRRGTPSRSTAISLRASTLDTMARSPMHPAR